MLEIVIIRRILLRVVFYLSQNVVTWSSQQRIVTLSLCKAKYITLIAATCQSIWLTRLIEELIKVELKLVKILVDNKSAIKLSKNLAFHNRLKHIEVRHHYVQACVEKKIILEHVASKEQRIDILTKAFGRVKSGKL